MAKQSPQCAVMSEIVLCYVVSLILLVWGGGINYAQQTMTASVFSSPIQYGWLSTASGINTSLTTTVRNTQAQPIGPYSEENYGAYEIYFTVIPGCFFAVLAILKSLVACIGDKSADYDSATVVSSVITEEMSADEFLDKVTMKTEGFGDIGGLTQEDTKGTIKEKRKSVVWGTLFFPMYIATGLFMYVFAGSWWLAIMMYHFGHVFITQKYFFVVGMCMMGLSLICVEVATALVVSKRTKNGTVAGLTWAIWFVSLFAYIIAMATVGNVISNQESAWENPFSGADAAYTSLTVYTLATPTRDLRSTPTLYYYDILDWIRVVVYFYGTVQAIRLLRTFVLLFLELNSSMKRKVEAGSVTMSTARWWIDLGLWLGWVVAEVAMYAEPIIIAIAFCHTDGDVIYIQRHMIPGRTKM